MAGNLFECRPDRIGARQPDPSHHRSAVTGVHTMRSSLKAPVHIFLSYPVLLYYSPVHLVVP